MPILNYQPPKTTTISVLKQALLMQKVIVTSGLDWFKTSPLGDRFFKNENSAAIEHSSHYLRICPTKETPEKHFYAGMKLGSLVAASLEIEAKR